MLVNGKTFHDLRKAGVLYLDGDGRVIVPPVLWLSVLGQSYADSLFGLRPLDSFGMSQTPDTSGEMFETRVTEGLRTRVNVPFARWAVRHGKLDAAGVELERLEKRAREVRRQRAAGWRLPSLTDRSHTPPSPSTTTQEKAPIYHVTRWQAKDGSEVEEEPVVVTLKDALPQVADDGMWRVTDLEGLLATLDVPIPLLRPAGSSKFEDTLAAVPGQQFTESLKDDFHMLKTVPLLARLDAMKMRDNEVLIVAPPPRAATFDLMMVVFPNAREDVGVADAPSRPLVLLFQQKGIATPGVTPPTLTEREIKVELVKAVGWTRARQCLGGEEVDKILERSPLMKPRLENLDAFFHGCDVGFFLVTGKKVPDPLPAGVRLIRPNAVLVMSECVSE